ncbi:MAG: glycosyltransferase, partial [Eubacterium sp.]|nr:glycosyltransferase [Eubacterium sp.]
MKILFATGGTAGHINPALAVASYIKEIHKDAEILFVGTADHMEA